MRQVKVSVVRLVAFVIAAGEQAVFLAIGLLWRHQLGVGFALRFSDGCRWHEGFGRQVHHPCLRVHHAWHLTVPKRPRVGLWLSEHVLWEALIELLMHSLLALSGLHLLHALRRSSEGLLIVIAESSEAPHLVSMRTILGLALD